MSSVSSDIYVGSVLPLFGCKYTTNILYSQKKLVKKFKVQGSRFKVQSSRFKTKRTLPYSKRMVHILEP